MVNVSRESALQTEVRLRHVIRQATLHIYDGAYAFEEFSLGQFGERADPSALAIVRDDHIWSQLRPAHGDEQEVFVVWRFEFPRDIDNSGFVGWLASILKAKFGTGVFVTCGSNSNHGGIFDYWGAPLELAEPIIQELRKLHGAPDGSDAEETSLDGVMMTVIETSASSVIGPETVFRFQQDGAVVRAEYEGGQIVAGSLVGKFDNGELTFCFSQIESPWSLQTGASVCTLVRHKDAFELVENFQWTNEERSAGRNVLRELS
jgi:hypothetical protein